MNKDGLLSLQREIGESNCCVGMMNVTNIKEVKAAVHGFAEKTGGKIDALFNNAGIVKMGPHQEISIEDQHRIVDVNFKGILNCIHADLPFLERTSGAHIINMSSASAIYGIPELAVYSATKHAVRALTEALRIEFERNGITVCDILVPYVRTPLIMDAPKKAFSVERMGVRVEAHHVAETVWKAARSSKLHWRMTGSLKLLTALFWLFPFAKQAIIKMLTVRPDKE